MGFFEVGAIFLDDDHQIKSWCTRDYHIVTKIYTKAHALHNNTKTYRYLYREIAEEKGVSSGVIKCCPLPFVFSDCDCNKNQKPLSLNKLKRLLWILLTITNL